MWIGSVEHALIKGAAIARSARHAVDATGLRDDRRFVVVDRDANQLYAWRSPRLCAVAAELDGERLTVRLPDGESATGDLEHDAALAALGWDDVRRRGQVLRGPFAALLSRHLRRPVELVDLGSWTMRGVDVEPVTLVSDASVRHLAERLGRDVLDGRRFRANLVVEGAERPHQEDEWIGSEVLVGPVRLQVTGPIPRCAVVTRDPDTGARDADALRVIRGYRGTFRRSDGGRGIPFGVYARVVSGGEVAVGDPVSPA
jgi:uncharacterized protein